MSTPIPEIASHPSAARWALGGLSLCMLMPSLDTSIANAGLPALARAFGASFPATQWIVLSYLLAITALIVGAGRLGDLVGRRRLLLWGVGIFTAASLLCGLAPSLGLLVTARAAQGLGAAVMMALTVAFVGDTVPKARTGAAMGLLGSMSAIGTTLGPPLGGLLIAGLGWRWIFLVNAPIGIVTWALAYHLPADRRPEPADRADFDIKGALLLTATLVAYALAMTTGRGHFGPANAVLLAAGAAGAGLFLWAEARAVSPLVRLAMFRDPVLSAGLAMGALVSTVMMATLVVGPFYLSRGLGLDTALVGLALSAGPLVAAMSGVPAGRLVDRLGARRMTLIGLMGMGGGAGVLALASEQLGVAGYVAPIVAMTAGYALFQAANNTVIMRGVGPDQRGVVSGLMSLSRNLGLITGTSAMGAVFAAASATSDIMAAQPGAVAAGMRTTFAAAAGLVVVAITVAAGSHALARPALQSASRFS